MNIPVRTVIHMKDVVMITGLSERSARRILYKIRKHHEKVTSAFVTIEEFCAYTGLKEEHVRRLVK